MFIANAYASASEHASSSAGMPQFDSSTFSSQSFWAVVSFVILMTLMIKFVIPAIQDVLDSRGNKIANDLERADKAREEAEEMLAKYRRELADANKEAIKVVEGAKLSAARLSEKAVAAQAEELAKRKDSAIAEIEQLKRQAMAEITERSVEVAMMATEKLISKAVSKSEANKMVNDAIEQIKSQDLH